MFRLVLAVVAVAGSALACSSPPPQVNNLIRWTVSDQNVTGCQSIEPDAAWVNRLHQLPARVEVVPKSVKDVEVQLWGSREIVHATLYWKAENQFGGTSQRKETAALGRPDIADDCTFTVPRY